MLNERGKLSWVQSDQIIYAWPLRSTARIWKMTNKSSASLTNLGSSYVASRGTYLVQYQSSTTRAKLSLISSQTDATSLTAQLTLTLEHTPSSLTSAFISAIQDGSDSSSDYVSVAIPYQYTSRRMLPPGGGGGGGGGVAAVAAGSYDRLAIYQIKMTSGTTLASHKLLTY